MVSTTAMQFDDGARYDIDDCVVPTGIAFSPIRDAKFVRSYDHYGRRSLVFTHSVRRDDFFDWLKCWGHIAANQNKGTLTDDPIPIETHVYDSVVLRATRIP